MDKAFTAAAALLAATFVLAIGTGGDVDGPSDQARQAIAATTTR